MKYKINFSELNNILTVYAGQLLPKLLPQGRFEGGEYVALNPTRYDEHLGSFRINRSNIVWCDFATDEKGKGFISLYCYLNNIKPAQAALELSNMFNITAPRKPSPERAGFTQNTDSSELINKIWSMTGDANGTIAEKYLQARGITGSIPPTIRYLPNCKHKISATRWPCMVAAITRGLSPEIVALHRTYLCMNGDAKAPVSPAKMMIGKTYGGAVKLAPVTEQLILAEGIETALSINMQANYHLKYGVWAVLSAGGYLNVVLPPLPLAATIIIAADNDQAGVRAVKQAASKWVIEGRKVKLALPPANKDFNDLLMEGI